MALSHVFSFLVKPLKGQSGARHGNGAELTRSGRLFDLVRDVYQRAPDECDIDITFKPTEDGRQSNPCRDAIVSFATRPTINAAQRIARRLEAVTDRRSGIGLLFIMQGRQNGSQRVVISRFPTDEAILAEEEENGLSVEYLERVFLKNKSTYKAVMYEDDAPQDRMWSGVAVDRQNSERGAHFSSDYWIGEFLLSNLSTTARRGTRRFGIALREAAKKAEHHVRSEIVSAATLATGLRGQRISIAAFGERFGLSHQARAAIRNELKPPEVENERFRLDPEELDRVVGFRSVELNNGGIMTAPSSDFDDIFEQEALPRSRQIRFTTQGEIVGEKLQKAPRVTER